MNKLIVNTWYGKDKIVQSITSDDDNSIIKSITKQVIQLKEQGVIDALIALGWTPPKGVYGTNERTKTEGYPPPPDFDEDFDADEYFEWRMKLNEYFSKW